MGLRNDASLGQPLATSGSAIGGRGREWRRGIVTTLLPAHVVKGLTGIARLSAH
jgi:hypothetical protein